MRPEEQFVVIGCMYVRIYVEMVTVRYIDLCVYCVLRVEMANVYRHACENYVCM